MLSIRTQDKMALLPYDKRISIYVMCKNHKHQDIITNKCELNLGGYPLGTYATKERALEVLDEITICVTDTHVVYNDVYQMPKE